MEIRAQMAPKGGGPKPVVQIKRVYEAPARDDGQRILVERLWPRGFTKDALRLDDWAKDVAPSHALRGWFAHDPRKWEEFRRRYRAELDARTDAWQPLLEAARRGPVTLLFSARDPERNSAVVLRDYLEARVRGRRGGP